MIFGVGLSLENRVERASRLFVFCNHPYSSDSIACRENSNLRKNTGKMPVLLKLV